MEDDIRQGVKYKQKDEVINMFQTIRQVSRSMGIPEHLLRSLVAQGKCPGIYSGTRFLVHVEALREYLNAASRDNKEAQQNG